MKINIVFSVVDTKENDRAKDLAIYFNEFIEETTGLVLNVESIEYDDSLIRQEI